MSESGRSAPPPAQQRDDAGALLERLLEGDRIALARLTRLVNSFLGRWNAYDFRDDWDDLIQEVLTAACTAQRDGKLRDRAAVAGYLRSTARNKFIDRLKASRRLHEKDRLPWEDALDEVGEGDEAAPAGRLDVTAALERLPDKCRLSVVAVHLEGRTYEEAARETGIPLGSLKRHLRDGLAQLREELEP